MTQDTGPYIEEEDFLSESVVLCTPQYLVFRNLVAKSVMRVKQMLTRKDVDSLIILLYCKILKNVLIVLFVFFAELRKLPVLNILGTNIFIV